MSTSQREELERLRSENHSLNEQVKKLVRAERSLALSQQLLDRRLHNLEVLNQFALAAALAERHDEILRLALEMLLSLFPYEQAMGYRRSSPGTFDPVAIDSQPGCEPPYSAGALATHAVAERLSCRARLGTEAELRRLEPSLAPLLDAFAEVFGMVPESTPGAPMAFIPAAGREREPSALLLLRRNSVAVFLLDPLPGPEDLPFLSLVGTHAASALRNLTLLAEAREAIRARDEFLSIASHELRTPLTSLALQVQALGRATGSQPASERAVALLERQYKRLSTLVEQLLDVSRIRVGHLELRCAAFDLPELAREVLLRVEANARQAGCTLELDAPDPVTVWADRSQIDQVLTNLLTNAIKFGAGQPISMTIAATEEFASVQVTDQGIGIDEKDQSRVFGRFERAVSTRHFGGLGLGLYIARQVVQAHGGDITVESQRGRGARFRVQLPRRLALLTSARSRAGADLSAARE